MFSYSIPIIKNNKIIGVMGAEVDVHRFLDASYLTKIYKNAKFFIYDQQSSILYKNGKFKKINLSDSMIISVINDINNNNMISLEYENNKYRILYQTLLNGMKFILVIPECELYYLLHKNIINIILFLILFIIIFSFIYYLITKKITKNLEYLSKVAKNISDGKLDNKFFNHNDEIGILSMSMEKMQCKINESIKEINRLAYKDDLTQVSNKTAYTDYI